MAPASLPHRSRSATVRVKGESQTSFQRFLDTLCVPVVSLVVRLVAFSNQPVNNHVALSDFALAGWPDSTGGVCRRDWKNERSANKEANRTKQKTRAANSGFVMDFDTWQPTHCRAIDGVLYYLERTEDAKSEAHLPRCFGWKFLADFEPFRGL